MVSAMTDLSRIKIDTMVLPMDSLSVDFIRSPDDCKSRAEVDRNTRMVLPDGRRLEVSNRFWNSWCSLQNQGRSVFDLFSHAEVFSRIVAERGDRVRIAIETYDNKNDVNGKLDGRLLSCTNPTKPVLPVSNAANLVFAYDGRSAQYEDGIVTAIFDCPFPTPYNIAGDEYKTQFAMQMPVDGYGMPQSYLALLRLICTNGMIGMTKAFKTSFQLGRGEHNIHEVLNRAMTTFSAEEGFHSFKLRMEAASQSWASLGEAGKLCTMLNKSMHDDNMPVPRRVNIIEKFDELCGDPLKYYGLSGRQELSARRARTIPTRATIYELMVFASEVATHELDRVGTKNNVNSWVGESVANEYDLEGSCQEFPDWKDFFVKR